VFRNHTPVRTCIGCGLKGKKRDFIRLVNSDPEVISIDNDGFLSGRGVYLCRTPTCLDKVFKGNRIEKAFRTQILFSDRVKKQLVESVFGFTIREEKVG